MALVNFALQLLPLLTLHSEQHSKKQPPPRGIPALYKEESGKGFTGAWKDVVLLPCRWKDGFKERVDRRSKPRYVQTLCVHKPGSSNQCPPQSGMSFYPLAAWRQARQKSGSSLGLLTGPSVLLSVPSILLLTDHRKDDGPANFAVNSYSIHPHCS